MSVPDLTSVYTWNLCTNPSFEKDLAGVVPLAGTSISRSSTYRTAGSYSLQFQTPGRAVGEGVKLPPVTVPGTVAACVSFDIMSPTPELSAPLTVSAINQSGVVRGTMTYTPLIEAAWDRVTLDFNMVSGDTVTIYIESKLLQHQTYNIDSVQIEPATSINGGAIPTPYIDGDHTFGVWTGTPEDSSSYRLYQNMLAADGGLTLDGAGQFLDSGAVYFLVSTDPTQGPTTISGMIDMSGVRFQGLSGWMQGFGSMTTTGMTVLYMNSGMDDFAIWTSSDPDPAMTLIGYNNAGVSTGTNTSGSAGYTRAYATFSAPQAFTGSTTVNVWNTAAYYAVGYQFASVASNISQNIADIQAEVATSNTPTAFIRPRALTAVLAPTSINYVTNPSFDDTTTGWYAVAGATLAIETTNVSPVDTSPTGHALNISGTAAYTGAYVLVSNLIVGEEYTLSGYCYPTSSNIFDIQAVASPGASGAGSAIGSSNSGAVQPSSLPTAVWYRPNVQFKATASTMTFAFWAVPKTGTSGTYSFILDTVMISPGSLEAYGDGYSDGWGWGSTPSNSPSYYYERGNVAYASVNDVLAQHIPLGQTAQDPVYFVPPTQYS